MQFYWKSELITLQYQLNLTLSREAVRIDDFVSWLRRCYRDSNLARKTNFLNAFGISHLTCNAWQRTLGVPSANLQRKVLKWWHAEVSALIIERN